jgi:putative sigma-54 modulation protein
MIKKLEINGVHMTVGKDLQKYVYKKIGGLEKYVPRSARESVHVEIKLKEGKAKDKNARTAEVIMHLPQEVITITETTVNIYAAIDIAEEKLKKQLHKYKELHDVPRLHRRLLAKLRRQPVALDLE